eukprot:gene17921-24314_t
MTDTPSGAQEPGGVVASDEFDYSFDQEADAGPGAVGTTFNSDGTTRNGDGTTANGAASSTSHGDSTTPNGDGTSANAAAHARDVVMGRNYSGGGTAFTPWGGPTTGAQGSTKGAAAGTSRAKAGQGNPYASARPGAGHSIGVRPRTTQQEEPIQAEAYGMIRHRPPPVETEEQQEAHSQLQTLLHTCTSAAERAHHLKDQLSDMII